MKDNAEAMFWSAFGAVAVTLFVVALSPVDQGREEIRREAVLKGHAEYAPDADGAPVFKWKEIK